MDLTTSDNPYYNEKKFAALIKKCEKHGHDVIFNLAEMTQRLKQAQEKPEKAEELIEDILVSIAVCDYWMKNTAVPKLETLTEDLHKTMGADHDVMKKFLDLQGAYLRLYHMRASYLGAFQRLQTLQVNKKFNKLINE